MVEYTGRGLVVKRPGVLSKVQMLNLVLGVGVFSLLPRYRTHLPRFYRVSRTHRLRYPFWGGGLGGGGILHLHFTCSQRGKRSEKGDANWPCRDTKNPIGAIGGCRRDSLAASRNTGSQIGTEKTMTATDVTEFCAFFSARKSGNFLHILGPVPYLITQ